MASTRLFPADSSTPPPEKTIEDKLRLARRRYGYDLWFNASDLDRGPGEFGDLLEKFRLQALE